MDIVSALRGAGLRVTSPRLATYQAVLDAPHSTADAVQRTVRDRLGTVSTQGIYDALRVLTDQDLLRRIEPAGSAARYEARTGDNHHHVVCRSCGSTQDVDCAVEQTPCLVPSSTHGFVLDEAEVTWWGLCPDCHAASTAKHADSTAQQAGSTAQQAHSTPQQTNSSTGTTARSTVRHPATPGRVA